MSAISDKQLREWAERSLSGIIESGFQQERDHALALSAYIFGADPLRVALLEQDYAHYLVEELAVGLPITLVLTNGHPRRLASRSSILESIREAIDSENDEPDNFDPRARYDLDEVRFSQGLTYAPSRLPEQGREQFLSTGVEDDMSLAGCLVRALKIVHGADGFTITPKELQIASLTITRGADTEIYKHRCPVLIFK